MKLQQSKKWYADRIAREKDYDVTAGIPGDRKTSGRPAGSKKPADRKPRSKKAVASRS